MTLPTTWALWQQIEAGGKNDFLVQPGRRFSYRDLAAGIRHWLGVFDAAGLVEGDRVVLQTSSEEAAIFGFIAAILDGAVPVLLAADTPRARAEALCEAVSASLIVVDSGLERSLPPGAQLVVLPSLATPARRRLFGPRQPGTLLPQLPHAPATRDPRLPVDPAGLAYILFTSGTTAAPVGVAISRGNLFANITTLSRLFEYDTSSVIFNDMILAHADGMIQGPILAVANGCSVARSGGFRLNMMEQWLGRVRTMRCTHVITVPTIWSMIDQYARHDDYFDAPECRMLLSVAAKLPEELWRRLETRFQRPVFNQYGLTETVASALYAGPHPEMGAFATIGRPVDCEARIDPAAVNGEGELQLRGDNVFADYWRDPERTAASFTADSWLKTGDLARRRKDESYEVLGRLKTVIMSGGFLIRPDEVDEAMLRHPQVDESVTVGVDDAMFDEIPVTAVVCRNTVDEAQLTAHARDHLEPQKVPRRIFAVEAIPRGAAGKANIAAVRSLIKKAMAPAGGAPTPGVDVEAVVRAAAAEVFRIDPDALSLEMAQGSVRGWDSFSQLALLLTVEQALGLHIPASRMVTIETLEISSGPWKTCASESLRGGHRMGRRGRSDDRIFPRTSHLVRTPSAGAARGHRRHRLFADGLRRAGTRRGPYQFARRRQVTCPARAAVDHGAANPGFCRRSARDPTRGDVRRNQRPVSRLGPSYPA